MDNARTTANFPSPPTQSISTQQLPSTEEVEALLLFQPSASTSFSTTPETFSPSSHPLRSTTPTTIRGGISKESFEQDSFDGIYCSLQHDLQVDRTLRSPPTTSCSLSQLYILCDIVPSSWLEVLEESQSNGTCVVLESLGRDFSSLLHTPSNLFYMPYCYEVPDPFHEGKSDPNNRPNNNTKYKIRRTVGNIGNPPTIQICYRTWNYVLARALGIPIVSPSASLRDWIESEDPHDDYVWGDNVLYQQVISTSRPDIATTTVDTSKYAWLLSAKWWGKTMEGLMSSSRVSLTRREHEHDSTKADKTLTRHYQPRQLFLQNYLIMLLESSKTIDSTGAKQQDERGLCVLDNDHEDDRVSTKPNMQTMSCQADSLLNHAFMFHDISTDEMAALCRLTGANVFVVGHDCRYRDWIQQQNAQQRCLLLTSITDWSDAEWTHRFQEGVCSSDYASNMIFRPLDDTTVIESVSQGDQSKAFAVVRFTWLLDSICAEAIAPMRPYCIGLLVPEVTA